MTKVIISGCCGHMGRVIADLCEKDKDIRVAAGVDRAAVKYSDFPVYDSFGMLSESADVLIDFSSPAALTPLLDFCLRNSMPAVICTTGHSESQLSAISEAANRIPVFKSGNMSLGINLLIDLIKRSAAFLGEDFDIEIVEKHHNRKVDAPSGTALMLADAADAGLERRCPRVYERHSLSTPRDKGTIGLSSVRAGTIPGEHTVIFAGNDEVIELKHSVFSRDIFAAGAIRAAKFLALQKEAGMYDMGDIFLY
ncbi:MAG: 4-hydroxy-tetrahydrodipicolinate reductase [Clostridiales bacterium]|nr:4-hydroxy-tetrahydrodipicolinate reductase [Clostridiales bacterium]